MSEGCRRSGRLIANPRLYNWPKKKPVYMVLDGSENSKNDRVGTVRRGDVLDNLDVRRERQICKQVQNSDSSDADDDFFTPCEVFENMGGSRQSGHNVRESKMKLSMKMVRTSMNREGTCRYESKARKRMREDEATEEKSMSMTKGRGLFSSAKQLRTAKQKFKTQVDSSSTVMKRKLVLKRSKEIIRKAKNITPKTNQKKKSVRIYKRYIQKRLSPSIMKDVLGNISEARIKWLNTTGFGELLNFRMDCYAHNLGYNVVESFDAKTCSVKIKAGVIKIDDTTVHNVMGLPIGNEVIECNEKNSAYVFWTGQFLGCASSQITPLMVRNKVLGNRRADTNFKWNFMIIVYNFFIESNQNRYLMINILRFSGNIEKCSNYNWCQLLIEKLKTTHGYWAADRKRNFAGPLPFLIVGDNEMSNEREDGEEDVDLTMLDIVVRDEMENEEGMDTFDSEHLVNFESGKTNADVENEELLSLQEHILDMDVGVNKIMASIGVDVGHNMQSCDDQEIKKHFEEDTYIISFENNLKEFVDVYGRCLNNFEVMLALYPQNIRLAELKKEYIQYFKMFEAASPIAKNLLFGNVVDKAGKQSAIINETDFIPNYSLGLSQLTPKNLCTELEEISNSPKKGHLRLLNFSGEGQIVPKYVIDEKDVNRMVREKWVVDVISHVIPTKERNVWQWLFQNRKNRKENLFEWNGRKCIKAHFQSLQDNKMIMSTVIDSWTYLLNENETLKDDSSPLRALYLNKSEGSYSSKIGRYTAFDDHMDVLIKMVNEMHNK
ncbi:hypothetical protein POM88_020870 [Heracleum sosnowskyi]|uniref:Uncharacterized protein n=1 Tax=Heracleum sosnowskyi TaxID=360622 RepID=A0AAD8ICM6_9APIA|nr:hypothetical protein POM88_020870 [Heracleum sosnowskyi]